MSRLYSVIEYSWEYSCHIVQPDGNFPSWLDDYHTAWWNPPTLATWHWRSHWPPRVVVFPHLYLYQGPLLDLPWQNMVPPPPGPWSYSPLYHHYEPSQDLLMMGSIPSLVVLEGQWISPTVSWWSSSWWSLPWSLSARRSCCRWSRRCYNGADQLSDPPHDELQLW